MKYLLILCLVACGASARTKSLQSSLIVLNASRDTVLQVSRDRENQIVDGCLAKTPPCTKVEVTALLVEWRSKVDPVIEAIAKGYRILASAALLSDSKSAAEAGSAVLDAAKLAKELKR